MKINLIYYLIVLAGSIISLFVPLWFTPFVISILVAYFFEFNLNRSMLIHLIVYALMCSGYCLYAYTVGSKELVGMIGQIFQGMSFSIIMIFSSLLFGLSAMMGAWVGGRLRIKN